MNTDKEYAGLRDFIYHTCHKFQSKYGGDFEELVSEANEYYMDARRSYDPKKAKLITWVGFRIYKGLLETRRRWAYRNNRVAMGQLAHDPVQQERFRLDRLIKEVSQDAQKVLRIVLGNDPPIRKAIPFRSALVEFLRGLGWAGERIIETFLEIKEALS
jgi:hypothetical protein